MLPSKIRQSLPMPQHRCSVRHKTPIRLQRLAIHPREYLNRKVQDSLKHKLFNDKPHNVLLLLQIRRPEHQPNQVVPRLNNQPTQHKRSRRRRRVQPHRRQAPLSQ